MHDLSSVASVSNQSPSYDSDSDDGLEEHDGLLDPFELESDDDESSDDDALLQNTQGNSGPDCSRTPLDAKMPPNPFQSTLASESRWTTKNDERSAFENSEHPRRHLYDVDSFTKLLLTGKASSSGDTVFTNKTHDHGNTSTTSPAPFPAMLEPQAKNRQYFPETLQESSVIDERQRLASMSDSAIKKMTPVTLGQLHEGYSKEASRGATLSQAPHSLSGFVGSPTEPTSKSTPSSPQSPVNLNKPLPPPPVLSASHTPPSADAEMLVDVTVRENKISDQAVPSNSKPLLPLTSRYSNYIKPEPLVVTSEQSILGSGNPLEGLRATSINPPPSSSKPPPPPPPRRHGRARGVSASSTSSAISGVSAPLTPSSTDEFSSRLLKQQPPFPPARTPSNSSMNRPTRRSTHPDSPSTLPPPTPPRRRETSRHSYIRSGQPAEHLPPGIDRQHGDPWASWKSSSAKAWPGQELSDTDVLAGLSELQREVDELRGKIRG